jgi:hypothetical protein
MVKIAQSILKGPEACQGSFSNHFDSLVLGPGTVNPGSPIES